MTLSLKHIIVPGTLCCVLLMPVMAFAEDQRPARDVFTKAAGNVAPSTLFSAAVGTRAGELASPQRRPRGGGLGPVATGALIGAAAALVGTAVAARSYGENESGGFCGVCMMQWSSFTVSWAPASAQRSDTALHARDIPSPRPRCSPGRPPE